MFKSVLSAGIVFATLASLAACGPESRTQSQSETKPKAEPPLPSASTTVAPPPATGSIRGVVRFKGRVPIQPVIDFSSNPQCERAHPKSMRAETVVVNPNRTLRDAFVWIKSGLSQTRWAPPSTPAELDQVGCVYRPHVLGLMVNQQLTIRNSDPVNHDVNVGAVKNASSNEAEPPQSDTIHKRFSAEEIWFPVSCGVHPWMRSYLAVVSHPFFTVTGTGGGFELKSVPPGQYVLETIQEKLGKREQHVTVASNRTSVVDFAYAE